ncbi:MAG: hypothetical protein QXQ64_06510 [Candidatus Bathyarchaeia archaeon]
MREVVYCFDEFKAKVDFAKPLHHHSVYECKDPHGIVHWLTFRIYGVSKNGNHIVVFEEKHKLSVFDIPERYGHGNAFDRLNRWIMDYYRDLVDRYAKPLGSTEGEWRE